MKFRTTILQSGNNTGIIVPDEIVEQLGAGKRPPVTVAVGNHTYRNTIASMGGRFMISLSAENRAAAAVAGGDEVDVEVTLDTAPREVVVPEDLAAALDAEPAARSFFDGLSYSRQRWYVLNVEGAKQAATRQRRITKAVADLAAGKS